MPPVQFTETFLTSNVSSSLFLRSAVMEGPVKANVVLTHGAGEHSARYLHVGRYFAEKGYRLCAYDLRGHGRSQGRRGHVNGYGELVDDLGAVAEYYAQDGIPTFLYGHSLGGQITLNYILKKRPQVRGALIASPWLQLVFRPHPAKILLAKIMNQIWPSFTQNGPNSPAILSRDLDFLTSLPGEELTHHRMSARMYHELTAGALRAYEGAPAFDCPLLLMHGADDALTSRAATESFFERAASADKTLKIYPDMKHETHNEIGREIVIAQMVEWMDQRCG